MNLSSRLDSVLNISRCGEVNTPNLDQLRFRLKRRSRSNGLPSHDFILQVVDLVAQLVSGWEVLSDDVVGQRPEG